MAATGIYAAPDHLGRGGWTWYTGVGRLDLRAGVESVLGLRFAGSSLYLDPCIPKAWAGFEITVRRQSSRMHITVENPTAVSRGVSPRGLTEFRWPNVLSSLS